MLQAASGPSSYALLYQPSVDGIDALERATLLHLYGGIPFDEPEEPIEPPVPGPSGTMLFEQGGAMLYEHLLQDTMLYEQFELVDGDIWTEQGVRPVDWSEDLMPVTIWTEQALSVDIWTEEPTDG